MSKYKKLYREAQEHILTQNQLIQELIHYKKELEEAYRMMQALQTENQRFLEENSRFVEQLSAAKAEVESKDSKIRELQVTVQRETDNNIELVEAMDKLQKTSEAYIEGLKDSARLTGICEGCRFHGVNVQKCGTCTRNPRAVDKFEVTEPVKEEVVAEATDTAELLECEAEVGEPPVATPVEDIVPDEPKTETKQPAPKEKRLHRKYKGKGKKK